MTVDIKRLTAHLSQSQQEEISKAYKKQAENETAAFLWCFFLGWMGAHRFYLRQWGQGIIHLILALITVAIAVGGALAGVDPTIIVVAALPFGVAALIWEVIDLFRIDDEVAAMNLRLAETLIAGTMLADTSVLQQAQTKLDEVLHNVAAEDSQSTEGEGAAVAAAAAETDAAAEPVIAGSASEAPVETAAAAGATVERYEATTTTRISADPNADQKDDQPVPAGTKDWSETATESRDTLGGGEPGPGDTTEGTHIDETVTRAHTESGYSRTDSIDTVISESAAMADDAGEAVIAADMTTMSPAESEAPTWPNLPQVAPVSEARPVDFTDLGGPVPVTPVADIDSAGATPLIVALGEEAVTSPPPPAVDSYAPPVTEDMVADESDSTPVESYIPPIVPVVELDAGDTQPVATAPENEEPETLAELAGLATATGIAVDVAEPSEPEVPAELEVPAAPEAPAEVPDAVEAAGAAEGVDAAAAVAPPPEVAHAEHIEPASHLLKRIRVTRQIKVNGEVVEETSAEELIEADADPEPVRQRLRQQLHNLAAARMAELGITPTDQADA
jgi:TM2 domain-containing membrane protein YozV